MRGVAEANCSMRFLVSLGTSSAISEVGMRLPRGVYPELCKILPLPLRYTQSQGQNDTERRARNDRGELLNNLTLIVDKDGIINRHLTFKVRVLSLEEQG